MLSSCLQNICLFLESFTFWFKGCFFLANIPHKAGHHPSETFFLCYSCYAFVAVVLLRCLRISCEIHPSSLALRCWNSWIAMPLILSISKWFMPHNYFTCWYCKLFFCSSWCWRLKSKDPIELQWTQLFCLLSYLSLNVVCWEELLQNYNRQRIHVFVQNGLFCSLITT